MASFNKVIIAGNLVRIRELRYSTKGTAIAKIGLAVNRKYKTESGEQKEDVTFVDVDAFGKTAEIAGKYLKKGASCLIEGRLKLDQWDDKTTGKKQSRLGVVCETMQMLGGKASGTEQAARPTNQDKTNGVAPQAQDGDDEVPF